MFFRMATFLCENGDYSCLVREDIEADECEIMKCDKCDGWKAKALSESEIKNKIFRNRKVKHSMDFFDPIKL